MRGATTLLNELLPKLVARANRVKLHLHSKPQLQIWDQIVNRSKKESSHELAVSLASHSALVTKPLPRYGDIVPILCPICSGLLLCFLMCQSLPGDSVFLFFSLPFSSALPGPAWFLDHSLSLDHGLSLVTIISGSIWPFSTCSCDQGSQFPNTRKRSNLEYQSKEQDGICL